MSRTREESGSKSPVKRYLSFNGKGKIKFYDKEHDDADEKGNVYLDSLDLILLDIKSSVSGFNESTSSSVRSNLLNPMDTGKEDFVVKTKIDGKFGEAMRGVWKDIKAEAAKIGGKFTTNLFALATIDGEQQIVRLELNGASLTPWIEYTKEVSKESGSNRKIYDYCITITKGQLCTRKKGKTEPVKDAEYKKIMDAIKKDPMAERPVLFYTSAFSHRDLTEEEVDEAIRADAVLQEYFDGIKGNVDEAAPDTDSDEDKDPFEGAKSSKKKPAPAPVAADGTEEEEDDDLPF